ncbi:putative mannose-1-phosphate guanylyltransferase 2 [Tasmannia lanceolata]|uniref:putative mannose-1-phosphate guanylyltransferase 2 n=1 Tax=Tasmannia lanceolata TaxID=3420 RepID=UPI0040631043
MKALILVGGFGTRFDPLTLTLPMGFVEFANKPLILHQIEALKNIGITEVLLAFNDQPEVLLVVDQSKQVILDSLIQFGNTHGINITVLPETERLGNARALASAKEPLLNGYEEPFLVMNSDIISDYPLRELIHFHKAYDRDASIMVKVYGPSKYGVVALEQGTGRVKKFFVKPKTGISTTINTGIYVMNPSIFDRIELTHSSIEKDVFPKIAEERRLYGMVFTTLWMDIKDPNDYLLGLAMYLQLLRGQSPSQLATGSHIVGNVLVDPTALIGDDCKIGPDVSVGPNCVIHSGVRLVGCTIMRGATIHKHARISNSIVGCNSIIGDWSSIDNYTILGEYVTVRDEVQCNRDVVSPCTVIESNLRSLSRKSNYAN